MKNLFKCFGIAALVAVIGFGVVACGDSGGNGSSRDSRLVLENGYAWTDVSPDRGYIFNANGTYHYITKPVNWSIDKTGTWSTSEDNSLTLIEGGVSTTLSYTVTNTTLTTTHHQAGTVVYTKTAVTIP